METIRSVFGDTSFSQVFQSYATLWVRHYHNKRKREATARRNRLRATAKRRGA